MMTFRAIDQRLSETFRLSKVAAERVHLAAQQLDDLCDDLGDRHFATELLRGGAAAVDRIGLYLEKPATYFLADLEGFARERSLAVAATALLVGFSISRVGRAAPRASRPGTISASDDAQRQSQCSS